MSDEPQIDDEDWLIVHLNGFASGREHERKQIAQWLRQAATRNKKQAYFLADLIDAGEHLK